MVVSMSYFRLLLQLVTYTKGLFGNYSLIQSQLSRLGLGQIALIFKFYFTISPIWYFLYKKLLFYNKKKQRFQRGTFLSFTKISLKFITEQVEIHLFVSSCSEWVEHQWTTLVKTRKQMSTSISYCSRQKISNFNK